MSMPPKPPERLAEILLEILALSDSTHTSQSESSSDADRAKEQPRRSDEENNNPQRQ
jgi:hypothetical protein